MRKLTIVLSAVLAAVLTFGGVVYATTSPDDQYDDETGGPPGQARQDICHGTGSATNPFVLITVPVNSAHFEKHLPAGDDVLPVNGECPGAETTEPTEVTEPPEETTVIPPEETTVLPPEETTVVEETTMPEETTVVEETTMPTTMPEETTVSPPEETTVTPPEETTVVPPEETTVTPPEETTVTPPEETTTPEETTDEPTEPTDNPDNPDNPDEPENTTPGFPDEDGDGQPDEPDNSVDTPNANTPDGPGQTITFSPPGREELTFTVNQITSGLIFFTLDGERQNVPRTDIDQDDTIEPIEDSMILAAAVTDDEEFVAAQFDASPIQAERAVDAANSVGTLPDTGGISLTALLAPLAALMAGSGILAYAVMRRS